MNDWRLRRGTLPFRGSNNVALVNDHVGFKVGSMASITTKLFVFGVFKEKNLFSVSFGQFAFVSKHEHGQESQ